MSKKYPKQTRRKTYDQDQPELERKQRQSLIISRLSHHPLYTRVSNSSSGVQSNIYVVAVII